MKKYHFIGIKGSGMSALANILHDMGEDVQGSDVPEYYFTQKELDRKNIPITNFDCENIKPDMTIIAGNAFNEKHEEIEEAKKQSIQVNRYHDFLGDLITDYTSIAVSGAHGKTSTTGLAAHVMKNMLRTSYLIGDGTGVGEKNSEIFVFEACEYKRHFLAYQPDYAIVTNIDFDHPDYFEGIDDVKDAFDNFIGQVKKQAIGCGDDAHVKELSEKHSMLLYGLNKNNDLIASKIRSKPTGTEFDVLFQENEVGKFFIPLHGNHHVLNALSVIAVCLLEKLDMGEVNSHFATYEGVKRRFIEEEFAGNILIDDYAHHPTEIKATIDSVRAKYPSKECIVVFQPHTFTRTKQFLREFANALSLADKVYLCDIFASAREKTGDVSIFDLINLTPHANHLTLNSMDQLLSYDGKVLLFMGAGDIQKYIQHYKEKNLQTT